MKKDINYSIENNRFNFRVAIFLKHNNRVLLHKSKQFNFWNMPGGRVQLGESTLEAIQRELKEELDIVVDNLKLICVWEDFFEWGNKNVQELLFVYTANIDDNFEITKKQGFATIDSEDEINYWVDINEIKNLDCKPKIIYNLNNYTNTLNHSINK